LNDFLDGSQTYSFGELRNGILQKFIEPHGDRNWAIQIQYTPQISVLEKRSAKRDIADVTADLYERLCTFEGPE
jgi:hypothetical protein